MKNKIQFKLLEKIKMGGNNSASALRTMRNRDFEENRNLRIEVNKERKNLIKKRLKFCPECKKPKTMKFKLCYTCFTNKKLNT